MKARLEEINATDDDMKQCRRCKEYKSRDLFHVCWAKKDGLQSYCAKCNVEQYKEKNLPGTSFKERHDAVITRVLQQNGSHYARTRNEQKRKATPKWVDKTALKYFKVMCRFLNIITENRYELRIDHICPLQHAFVSGLNVPWNLQILTHAENSKKGNRFWPDMACEYTPRQLRERQL